MSERSRLLQSIAATISDYQSGILAPPTSTHVDRWIGQFPAAVRLPILTEMDHVLAKTYYSKDRVRKFIRSVIRHRKWTGDDPAAFWETVHFLDLQPKGNSQRAFTAIFDEELTGQTGLSVAQCGKGNRFLYLDDGLFSGGRLGSDLTEWIAGPAPRNAELIIAVIALHTQGRFFMERALKEAIEASGKRVSIRWGRSISIEDGLFAADRSDVLRPTGPGTDPAVLDYVATLEKPQTWRSGNGLGPQRFFSSDHGRRVLEQEFLKAGVLVRAMCPNFNAYQRPLGNTTMKTVGFGTLFATYRNCPNNAPLVLWAGEPWFPLLPRVINQGHDQDRIEDLPRR